jgi:hypothetical protein
VAAFNHFERGERLLRLVKVIQLPGKIRNCEENSREDKQDRERDW